MFSIPSAVRRAIALLAQSGHVCYPVGGCVRDLHLGKAPSDWDLCTSALPETMIEVFADYPTFAVGVAHGTVGVMLEGMKLEITTFRADGAYSDARHPDAVSFGVSLEEDLARRDFTVCAMALDGAGETIDLFGGLADLRAGVLRAVGDPDLRFREDALRIMRCLRFAAVLGFEVAADTAAAVHRGKGALARIAHERIDAEWLKLLSGEKAADIIKEYAAVLAVALPQIQEGLTEQGRLSVGLWRMAAAQGLSARFARLLCGMGYDKAVLSTFTMDRSLREDVGFLMQYDASPVPAPKEVHRFLCEIGEGMARRCLPLLWKDKVGGEAALCEAERILSAHLPLTVAALVLRGDEIAARTGARGPEIGALLRALLEAVAMGACENTREGLLRQLTVLGETKKEGTAP